VLRVECTKCDRKGRYSVAKLIAKHGRNGNDWTECYRLVADERNGRPCRRRAANLQTCVLL
jgi:hypothetical protein